MRSAASRQSTHTAKLATSRESTARHFSCPALLLVLAVSSAMACNGTRDASSVKHRELANYQLTCSSTDTRTGSSLFCLRHDTRTGEVHRVAIDRIPVSQGPTTAASGPPGRYDLVCDATSSELRSDLYCIRLNAETGELLLIALPKTPQFPSPADGTGNGQQ